MDKVTDREFWKSVIAQHDDEDWQESGYIACYHKNVAYLTNYYHCSCYGTFEALCGGGISDRFSEGIPSFIWSGTLKELVDMAKRGADPHMPSRVAKEADCDYKHLMEVYKQILEWYEDEYETV